MKEVQTHYRYVGCFIKPEVWQNMLCKCPEEHLAYITPNPHITFVYEPAEVQTELFGTTIRFTVIGYGKNDDNEGFLIKLIPGNSAIDRLAEQINVPHVTISVSEHGQPVNTTYLDFKPVSEPFEAVGIFGGFIEEESRVDWGVKSIPNRSVITVDAKCCV